MSRCPYCRRELTGFDTICKDCCEAGYDRVTDIRPWWRRRQLWHRPRFTWTNILSSLFFFVYAFLVFRIDAYHPLTWIELAVVVFGLALCVLLMGSNTRNSNQTTRKRSSLWGFLSLVFYLAIRLGPLSYRHRSMRNPALWAFVGTATVFLIESTRRDPKEDSAKK